MAFQVSFPNENMDVTVSNYDLINLMNCVPGGSLCSSKDIETWLEKEEEVNLPLFKVMSDEELLNTHAGLQLPMLKENEAQDSCDESEELEDPVDEVPTSGFILKALQSIVNWTRRHSEFTEEERSTFIKARNIALNFVLQNDGTS